MANSNNDIKMAVDEIYRCFNEMFINESIVENNEKCAYEIQLPEDFLGKKRILRLGFTENFPLVYPKIRITPSPKLEWPHVLDDFVCLYGPGQEVAYGNSIQVMRDVLSRLSILVGFVLPESSKTIRDSEFSREILSYWAIQVSLAPQNIIIINTPTACQPLYTISTPSNNIKNSNYDILVSDNIDKLASYYSDKIMRVRKKISPTHASFYVKLLSIPDVKLPSVNNIEFWLKNHISENDFNLFCMWLTDSSTLPYRWIIFQIPHDQALIVQSFTLKRSSVRDNSYVIYGLRGYKKWNKIIPRTSKDKLFINNSFIIDNKVIFSRLSREYDSTLFDKKVLLIGAGSLGSQVAHQLVHCGVLDITIVDPDTLSDANLGRHLLTINDLGRKKSKALCEYLNKSIPTSRTQHISSYFHEAVLSGKLNLSSFDCIITTTADWPTEYHLWSFKAKSKNFSLIQAWTEPYSIVGHILGCPANTFGDARHLFDLNGNFINRYTDWENNGITNLPACGSGFIPGNFVNIQIIASSVTKMAVEYLLNNDAAIKDWRSFVGETDKIAKLGGTYRGPEINYNNEAIIFKGVWNDD